MLIQKLITATITLLFLIAASIPADLFAEMSFQGIGRDSYAFDVSADGKTVAGGTEMSGYRTIRWTATDGITTLAGDTLSNCAISADGSTIVGSAYGHASAWASDGDTIDLGSQTEGYPGSYALGVSGDGSVVVGAVDVSFGYEAFYWTATKGIVGLGDLPGGEFESGATDVSSDGSIIAGYTYSDAGLEATRWIVGGGMLVLGDLPGGETRGGAHGLSADGAKIVGASYSSSGLEAFVWTEENGMVGMGDLPGGDFYSVARDVSDDGSIIVGAGNGVVGMEGSVPIFGSDAVIWDEISGIQSIKEILENSGLDLTGWRLDKAWAVSADGMTIVGTGHNPDGYHEGWIATIPEPCSIALLGLGALVLRKRRA